MWSTTQTSNHWWFPILRWTRRRFSTTGIRCSFSQTPPVIYQVRLRNKIHDNCTKLVNFLLGRRRIDYRVNNWAHKTCNWRVVISNAARNLTCESSNKSLRKLLLLLAMKNRMERNQVNFRLRRPRIWVSTLSVISFVRFLYVKFFKNNVVF